MDLLNRIRKLEQETGGKDFDKRMKDIFETQSYDLLTSEDVQVLQKFMPDKYEFIVSEVYKLTSANI